MQNAQMAQMAGLNAAQGGPMDGTPVMNALSMNGANVEQQRTQMNTYIYDYFLRNKQYSVARGMVEANIPMNLQEQALKQSPSSRGVNGVDVDEERKGLPDPRLPMDSSVENSFLMDWWCQFWDIFSATRGKGPQKTQQYSQQARQHAVIQNQQRLQQMQMTNGAGPYNNLMRGMNGATPNHMKRQAAMNTHNQNGTGPMNLNMKNPAMLQAGQQMQREGSGMDMNGQRPQSPGDNAPSPNKRPRVEGNMNPTGMAGNHFELSQQGQNMQQRNIEAMNAGAQGSPMNHQTGLDGQEVMYPTSQQPRQGLAGNPTQSNHALQDYQMQLMLLEQQNKKRLLMARQENDGLGPHNQGVPAQGFPPAMSPQGSRAGPSPQPGDMKRGTPKLNQSGLPGSPMPDVQMQQRSSPAPMNFVDQMPPGMPPQFPQQYGQLQTPMMRPPTSNQFTGQQMTPQMMEAMRANSMQNGGVPNGVWRAPGGMIPGAPPQPMPGQIPNPQQRGQMPPPPAPAGEQPRAQEPSPQQPAQAPPTPSQQNKANPKKKATKDNKPAKAKGANTGATPAATAEDPPPTPTPSTPITPMHKNSFAQNGQPPNMGAQPQPSVTSQGPPPLANGDAPFGSLEEPDFINFADFSGAENGFEDFNFDSFIEDPNMESLTFNLAEDGLQAGGDA